jgi:putative transposase
MSIGRSLSMPFKELTVEDQRRELVEMVKSEAYQVSEAAQIHGISRPRVYEWLKREAAGMGLSNRSSAPKSCPHRTPAEIVERLLEAKREKPTWGPVKQRQRLKEAYPDVAWPAASTIGDIYAAHGLVKRRKRRPRRIESVSPEQVSTVAAGEMMTADHKGWFRLGNRAYCYPLTICDPVSRYIYAIDALESVGIEPAKRVFVRVFEEYGVPHWILTDNGIPFCFSRSLGGLTALSVWWIKLGIQPLRIHKGSPWENGIHERMHRTLKDETTRPPAFDLGGQQLKFDEFRAEYVEDRPHGGLGGARPITQFVRSPRVYSDAMGTQEMSYPGHYEVRKVRQGGEIKWKGRSLFLSESLAGELVGFEEYADGLWSVRFGSVELARFDERARRLL